MEEYYKDDDLSNFRRRLASTFGKGNVRESLMAAILWAYAHERRTEFEDFALFLAERGNSKLCERFYKSFHVLFHFFPGQLTKNYKVLCWMVPEYSKEIIGSDILSDTLDNIMRVCRSSRHNKTNCLHYLVENQIASYSLKQCGVERVQGLSCRQIWDLSVKIAPQIMTSSHFISTNKVPDRITGQPIEPPAVSKNEKEGLLSDSMTSPWTKENMRPSDMKQLNKNTKPKFCPVCGGVLSAQSGKYNMYFECESCHYIHGI